MNVFRCPICGELKDVRLDKNHKYYIHCDDCGVQLFVRGKDGIKRMEALMQVSGSSLQEDEAPIFKE